MLDLLRRHRERRERKRQQAEEHARILAEYAQTLPEGWTVVRIEEKR